MYKRQAASYVVLRQYSGEPAECLSQSPPTKVWIQGVFWHIENPLNSRVESDAAWCVCVLQGSLYGDSQLIRLQAEAVDPAQPSNFVEVMDVWTNLGPIIDLAVVDLERQGQGQVVTCSGKGPDSSLRIVRNGIGMIEQAAVELAGQC